MSNPAKIKLYNEIIRQKKTLTVFKKNHDFNFEFPKKAFDRICQFYGEEKKKPISFILFNKTVQTFEFKKMSTKSVAFDENQISDIFEISNCFAIIPRYFDKKYNEAEIVEYAPKIDNKAMKNIIKKAGIHWDFISEYCDVQLVTRHVDESLKYKRSYTIIENVLKNVPTVNIKLVSGEKIVITYYSYKKILEKSDINLEKVLPYLNCEIRKVDREELENKGMPIYQKVKEIELKNRLNKSDMKDEYMHISKGTLQCHRYKKVGFDPIENNQKEISDLLKDLVEKVNNKKNKINGYLKTKDNHFVEIKDLNNAKRYIRKTVYDKILSDTKPECDLFKTNDIYGKELILSKKELSKNKTNPSLIKIYNKNQKDKSIFSEIKDIEEKIQKFTYIRQEEIFKGKNKDGEPIEEKFLLSDLEYEDLPKIDESKPLYSIYAKEDNNFETIKNNLLESLQKDNKDILLYKRKKNFVPVYLINEINERDRNIKNKNIKYTIKNQLNKKENIIMEYNDIFNEDNSAEYILIDNENNPEENLVVNKKDLYDSIKKWTNKNYNIIITNETNNNKIEINPNKIKIIKLEKEEIPKINEDIQEEIKDSKMIEKEIKHNEDLNEIKNEIKDEKQKENEKEGFKYRLKLRSMAAMQQNADKARYTIRRTIISRKKKK